MKRFLVLLADVISFGLTSLMRWLVKKKHLKRRYLIDIDRDGEVDVSISIHDTSRKEE